MMHCPQRTGVIGVFDSGVGGLTVVRRIWESLPGESILFIADQSHVPYGGRPLSEVAGFAKGISACMVECGAKSVVMACNISTATALFEVRDNNPDHVVIGMIGPGAAAAVGATTSGSIGVLATAGTVSTQAYTRAVRAIDPTIRVTEVACPEFVPLIESELTESPVAYSAAERYLAPIVENLADVVILGCTHYPFLIPCLQKIAPQICFIDPALQATSELATSLQRQGLCVDPTQQPRHILYTTGDPDSFAQQIGFFLPGTACTVKQAEWHLDKLCLDTDIG